MLGISGINKSHNATKLFFHTFYQATHLKIIQPKNATGAELAMDNLAETERAGILTFEVTNQGKKENSWG
ncbi:hypothetical protein ALP24_04113 [Pseudomonas syringae pv. aptata]|uniref:Uncharacterized protein n=1 Tax=Pseudomonas syringae pv. aptata TaxID=83167 RepID=A0A3M5WIM2_PSEAP|nr:hypothetical protein ALP24_04113 [Pseudomonas syringae pv. aptata]